MNAGTYFQEHLMASGQPARVSLIGCYSLKNLCDFKCRYHAYVDKACHCEWSGNGHVASCSRDIITFSDAWSCIAVFFVFALLSASSWFVLSSTYPSKKLSCRAVHFKSWEAQWFHDWPVLLAVWPVKKASTKALIEPDRTSEAAQEI